VSGDQVKRFVRDAAVLAAGLLLWAALLTGGWWL
jgi:hypothetical protein